MKFKSRLLKVLKKSFILIRLLWFPSLTDKALLNIRKSIMVSNISYHDRPAGPSFVDQLHRFSFVDQLVLLSGTSRSFSRGPAGPSLDDQLVPLSRTSSDSHWPAIFSWTSQSFICKLAGPFPMTHLILLMWTRWSLCQEPAGPTFVDLQFSCEAAGCSFGPASPQLHLDPF